MSNVEKILTAAVPVVTIIGLIVLLALKDIDQTTGITLIAAIVGVHGGGVLVNAGANAQAARADPQPPPAPAAVPALTEVPAPPTT